MTIRMCTAVGAAVGAVYGSRGSVRQWGQCTAVGEVYGSGGNVARREEEVPCCLFQLRLLYRIVLPSTYILFDY